MSFYDNLRQLMGESSQLAGLDCDANRDCFEKAVNGSEVATHEFITNNARLVSTAVSRFMARRPSSTYLVDDMFAEGLLTLTNAVRTLTRRLRDEEATFLSALTSFGDIDDEYECFHVIMYLYISIYRAIQRVYELDSSDAMSERTRQRHTAPGRCTPTRKVNVAEATFDALSQDPFREVFFYEGIIGTCKGAEEELIIQKRLEGFMDKEIAKMLACHRTYVTHTKNRLYRAFCDEHHFTWTRRSNNPVNSV